ncbi:MAG: UDP-N-acetylmuramoyl-L-alanyl-D-glutamate--2,6-diaminopimelate ligase [Chitinispirillales bacterium]|nr:UDP-N-acetylmuramoyl-L-alanyl-D-glutamate--2,6-diaminopimelate ligase [Chitinispirillales bacterium]
MKFRELLNVSGINVTADGGSGDPVISDIAYDSRNVKPGSLYVAVPGTKVHGDTFIESAIKNGAAAVVSENGQDQLSTPWAKVSDVRVALGKLGIARWGIDMERLTMVGVTGTNGKTTTVSLFKNLFDRVYGKECSWLFGTIANVLGNDTVGASHTTPEAVDIFRLINNAKVKPESLVMEVSSHALALKRVAGIKFNVSVWTNLTQDHLDFHKSMEEYYAAKKRLFVDCDYIKRDWCGVINVDDEYGQKLYSELKSANMMTYGYGRSDNADVKITGWKCDWGGTSVDIEFRDKKFAFTSPLRGFFNVYNMTAMITGAFALGIDVKVIKEALSSMPIVSGRMDIVDIDAPFTVVVDYAHTPDALVNVLKTCEELTTGRVICVFGCGGDRDKTKRPLMAKAVAENSDHAVVTSDNPRSEEPEAIINDILKGMPQGFSYKVMADRREAIKIALSEAKENDCVVIAGKGHENYQEVKGVKNEFDDRVEAVKAYKEMC